MTRFSVFRKAAVQVVKEQEQHRREPSADRYATLCNPATWALTGGPGGEEPRGREQLRGTTDTRDRRYRWNRNFQP